jgi:NADPH:quinone reductase-like Zn-dependent oxidoreductase
VRAIIVDTYGGTDVLRAADVPIPRPGRGEALVQMVFAGVNFIEIYQRKGQYQVPPPAILGTEGAGVVTAIGEEVPQLKIGQPGQQGDRARAGGEGLQRGAARDDWADRHRRLPWMGPILDPLGVPPRT